MPVVKVDTPKCCTAPKSPSASIDASAIPPTSAGRASGNATRKNVAHGPFPNDRLASSTETDCSMKAVRASRYTYG
jgi:hypothetical protein